MIHPVILGSQRRLNAIHLPLGKFVKAVSDPVHMLLDRYDHIAED